MQKCLFAILFVFYCSPGFAAVPVDSIPKEKYEMSRKEFISAYGKDDTSKALINFYFDQRSVKKDYYYFYAGVLIIEGILAVRAVNYDEEFPFMESELALTLGAFSAIVFIPITIYTLIKLNKAHKKFSKEKLYLDILNYQKAGSLPEPYKKQILENPAYWAMP